MNLSELREARRRERKRDSLQPLEESFYRDAADYIAERKAERDRVAERVDDPYGDPEVRQITDEIETAEEVVESLYERRIGKVVKHASFAAAEMQHDDEGLTAEERDLFDDLVDRIRANRDRVLEAVAETSAADADPDADATPTPSDGVPGPADASDADDADPVLEADDADAGPDAATADADASAAGPPPTDSGDGPDDAPVDETPPDPNDLLAEAMGGSDAETDGDSIPDGGEVAAPDASPSEPASATPSGPDAPDADDGPPASLADRETVRITDAVGEIYGVDDRAYELESGDVVCLPAPNAAPLLERDAAERL